MYKIEIEIPEGSTCIGENRKPCIMARYTKKWNAYNCAIYHKLLKGSGRPVKCSECSRYCAEISSKNQNPIKVSRKSIESQRCCKNCNNCVRTDDGERECVANMNDIVIVIEKSKPTEYYFYCHGELWEELI